MSYHQRPPTQKQSQTNQNKTKHRYIVTGFFDSQPLERQLANVECNATAAVALTHHFVGHLIQARVCVCVYVGDCCCAV